MEAMEIDDGSQALDEINRIINSNTHSDDYGKSYRTGHRSLLSGGDDEARKVVELTIPRSVYENLSSSSSWSSVPIITVILVLCLALLGYFIDIPVMSYSWKGENGVEEITVNMEVGLPPPKDTPIPTSLQPLVDVTATPSREDVAFFLHIPRSGGRTLMEIIGSCLGLIQASDIGGRDDHDQDADLQIVDTEVGKYVNVDLYTREGILRAKELDFLREIRVDVLSSPLLYDLSEILLQDREIPTRMMALIRNPIEMVHSYFHYMQHADWEQDYDPALANMTLREFLTQERDPPQFNLLTKMLVNKPYISSQHLTQDDLNLAKQILLQKTHIGLLDDKVDSFDRWEILFGWKYDIDSRSCKDNLLQWEYSNKNEHPDLPEEESVEYDLLVERNAFDLDLYEFAKKVFVDQAELFPE